MGTGWSQDHEASQLKPSEESGYSESQHNEEKTAAARLSETESIRMEKAEVKPQVKAEEKEPDAKLCDSKTDTKTVEVKYPHNYEIILRDADSPIDKSSKQKLYDQLCCGVFLNHKRKKYWVEKQSNSNCFFLFARDLSITWAEDNIYWHWPCLHETSDVSVEVAELLNVCWLEVHGKFDTTKLSPGLLYEVVFVIMLKDPAYGWEVPVNFRLTLPNRTKQEHKENLLIKTRGQWIEIPVGEFKTSPEATGEIEVSMHEYDGGKWKRGLAIKGIAIRPKT